MNYNALTKKQLIEQLQNLQKQISGVKLDYSTPKAGDKSGNIYNLDQNERLHIVIDDMGSEQGYHYFHDQENKYKTLFEKSTDAILVIENGKFVDCNQATIDMLGYRDKKEFLQTHPAELSPEKQPDGRYSTEKADEMMRIAIEQGSNRFEWDHVKADGEVFPVEVLLTPVAIEKDYQIIHTVWRDISARKESEQALLDSEKRLKSSLKRLELIRTFHETFIDALDLHTIFNRLYDFCPKYLKDMGVSRVSFLLWDEKKQSLISDNLIGAYHKGEKLVSAPQPRGMSISGKCFETGKPVVVNNCAESDVIPREWVKKLSLKSSLAVPVLLKDKIIGVLRFDNTVKENAFAESDLDFYLTLADQLGVIIGNSNLFAELKIAEEKTRESEERLKIIFESAPDAFFLTDFKGNLLDGNKAAEEMLGIDRSDLIGKNIMKVDILRSKDLLRAIKNIAKNAAGKSTGPDEFTLHRRDGKSVPVEIMSHPVKIKDTPVILGIARDISKRKKAEAQIAESRDRIEKQNKAIAQLAVDKSINSGDAPAALNTIMQTISTVLDVARASVWIFSDSEDELRCIALYDFNNIAHNMEAVLNTEDYPNYFAALRTENSICAHDAQHDPRTSEFAENYLKTYNIRSMLDVSIRISGKMIGVVCIEHVGEQREWHPEEESFAGTISTLVAQTLVNEERKNAVKALGESEERFRRLFADLGDAVFVTQVGGENQGLILEVNPAAERQTGYTREELIGMNIIRDISIKDSWDINPRTTEEKINQGEIISLIEKKKKKDGNEYWSEVVVTPIEYKGIKASLSINHDITHRRQLEEQLRQAQKMEAVGQLAGGVAHDFNNLLTIINGYSDLLLLQDLPGIVMDGLKQIRNAGNRAKQLTSQLLAFSRKQLMQPRILNLNTVISDYLKMLGRLLGENIEISTLLNPNLGKIKADPGQIEQVIMNVAINARDAMPEGGTLTIETENIEFDDSYIKKHSETKPGKYIMLAISDNGSGMDSETKAHIFEPFFTTKGREKGTGLGLATVYGIIKQNEGFIYVYSEPGKGTTFKIYLQRVVKDDETDNTKTSENSYLQGHETIMLVEDDPGVRGVTQSILENFGYNVLSAINGEEAFRLYKNNKDKIDLVLTDVIMPLMSGRELAEKIQSEDPKMKILYFSGYTDNTIVQSDVLNEDMEFIQKPYSPTELVKKLKEMLS